MSRKCKLMNKGPMVGNNVSHANNKTKRRFNVALKWSNIYLVIQNITRKFRVRISQQGARTIDKIRNTEGDDAALDFLKKSSLV